MKSVMEQIYDVAVMQVGNQIRNEVTLDVLRRVTDQSKIHKISQQVKRSIHFKISLEEW